MVHGTRLRFCLAAASIVAMLAGARVVGAERTVPSAVVLRDLRGAPRALSALSGHPAILLFWRSDCAPCRLELSHLADLEAAAKPGRLVTIALEDARAARSTLTKMAPEPQIAWIADGDPAAVLVAFNGAPPRLPLAVALTRAGRSCERHVGLLGTDRVQQWVRECS